MTQHLLVTCTSSSVEHIIRHSTWHKYTYHTRTLVYNYFLFHYMFSVAPIIISPLTDYYLNRTISENATFHCQATARPDLAISNLRWSLNGQEVSINQELSEEKIEHTEQTMGLEISWTSEIHLEKVSTPLHCNTVTAQDGEWRCIVSDGVKDNKSASLILTTHCKYRYC